MVWITNDLKEMVSIVLLGLFVAAILVGISVSVVHYLEDGKSDYVKCLDRCTDDDGEFVSIECPKMCGEVVSCVMVNEDWDIICHRTTSDVILMLEV